MLQNAPSLDFVLPFTAPFTAPAAAGWTGLLVGLGFVAFAVVHVAFAIGVLAHARGRRTVFVVPAIWALATLLSGMLGALAYWLVHVSALAAAPAGSDATDPVAAGPRSAGPAR